MPLLKDILDSLGKSLGVVLLCPTVICVVLFTAHALADDKYPSDQTEDENPYVMQPSVDPAPDTWIPKLRFGDKNRYAEIHGWLNKGLLFHDDGVRTLAYFPVDNDAGGSRIGVRLRDRMVEKLRVGVNIEVEWEPCSTINVNQADHPCSMEFNTDTFGWRKGEFILDHLDYGRVTVGQGPAAADNASQVDFSGTVSAGHSAAAAVSGGSFILFDDGTFSSLRWRDVIPNFDGFCCITRIRYDSPRYYGFSLAGSIGEDIYPERTHIVFTDIALRYRETHGGFKMGGAAAYSVPESSSNFIVNGSFSTVHVPTGLNVTIAGASANVDSRDVGYFYVKPGYQRDFFAIGKTAFSVDVYYGVDIVTQGSTSNAFGLQAVQNFDYWKSEVYVGLRWFDYDDAAADYNSAQALLIGTRVRF
jgi:hypothetical protein